MSVHITYSGCVLKADRRTYRICLDTRGLNAATVSDATRMPITDDVLELLQGGRIFTTLDLCSGYLQIPVHPDSRKYLAFHTPLGVFRFQRLPFGLKNACAAFNRILQTASQQAQLTNCAMYFDDITVFTDSLYESVNTVISSKYWHERVCNCLARDSTR